MSEWISVKDRLPEMNKKTSEGDFYSETVLILECGTVTVGDCGKFFDEAVEWNRADGTVADEVTHWMPLPEPPKESK